MEEEMNKAGTMEETAEMPDLAAQKAEQTGEEPAAEAVQETSSEETAGEAEQTEEGADGKKRFFKWKKEDKELAALKEQAAALEDRLKRQMAEFDNYRKRTEKEKSQMFSMGEQNVLEKFLPVTDNFERGLAVLTEEDKKAPVGEGMEMIYRQLVKQLEELGVTPIEAVGREFDPNFHNAVMQMESEELESGIIGQELLKGYMYHDTVLRHSMVAVVK